MIKLELKDNYTTGNYVEIGGCDFLDYISVEKLPEKFIADIKARSCYHVVEGEFKFDDDRYSEFLKEAEERKKLRNYKNQTDGLKEELSSTDYRVIKNMETVMPDILALLSEIAKKLDISGIDENEIPYDTATLHSERQKLRDRINEVELQLLSVTGSGE